MAPTITFFVNAFNSKLEAPVRHHLKNVYGCLALSTCLAGVGAYINIYTDVLQESFFTTVGALGLIFALLSTPDNGKNQILRLGYLMGFAFLTGLKLGHLLEIIIIIDPSIVITALISTAVVFISFTIASMMSERGRWLYLGGTLVSALNILLFFSLANIFFNSQLITQIHMYIGLLVMCGFIVYDTQLIIEKNRMGSKDFVGHSLDLFVDMIQVFRYLLVIHAQKEKSNKKCKQ